MAEAFLATGVPVTLWDTALAMAEMAIEVAPMAAASFTAAAIPSAWLAAVSTARAAYLPAAVAAGSAIGAVAASNAIIGTPEAEPERVPSEEETPSARKEPQSVLRRRTPTRYVKCMCPIQAIRATAILH